ncbi:hypothetical protein COO60DRAFT_1474422 [Scenedesmus sp. NREL 46B-D3]|nr:hypothetical protein COO60DRAFT_1474422 [Scenedesmus sp. NREL 46B-D3]
MYPMQVSSTIIILTHILPLHGHITCKYTTLHKQTRQSQGLRRTTSQVHSTSGPPLAAAPATWMASLSAVQHCTVRCTGN